MKTLKKSDDIHSFSDEVRRSLLYYFWCKYEWEITISSFPSKEKNTVKVDVYWQVMNNWDRFIEYVWSFKNKKNGER